MGEKGVPRDVVAEVTGTALLPIEDDKPGDAQTVSGIHARIRHAWERRTGLTSRADLVIFGSEPDSLFLREGSRGAHMFGLIYVPRWHVRRLQMACEGEAVSSRSLVRALASEIHEHGHAVADVGFLPGNIATSWYEGVNELTTRVALPDFIDDLGLNVPTEDLVAAEQQLPYYAAEVVVCATVIRLAAAMTGREPRDVLFSCFGYVPMGDGLSALCHDVATACGQGWAMSETLFRVVESAFTGLAARPRGLAVGYRAGLQAAQLLQDEWTRLIGERRSDVDLASDMRNVWDAFAPRRDLDTIYSKAAHRGVE